ncbi:hypothetical protein COCMIDRAFT_105585, partial [Bipolaris oryzae ATCC 44560]
WHFAQCPQHDVRRHFAAAATTGPTQPYEIFLTTTQPVTKHNQEVMFYRAIQLSKFFMCEI